MQRNIVILPVAALLLALGRATAQIAPAPTNSGASLVEVKKQFEASFRDLQRQGQESAKLHRQRYLDSLAALEEAFQATGHNMTAVLAVHGEQERFERSGDIPDTALVADPPALRKLQDAWRAQTAAWPKEQAQRIVSLSDQYLQNLNNLYKTMADNPAARGADDVQAEKERLLGNNVVREALALLQVARPPAPPTPEPTKPPEHPVPDAKPVLPFVESGTFKIYAPGNEPPLKNLLTLHLDFPSADRRTGQLFYEVHSAVATTKAELYDNEKKISYTAYTTVPRLTLTTKNREVGEGCRLVVEYYSHPLARMSNLRCERVEHLPLPAMVRGQIIIMDGKGISLTRLKEKSSTTREFYGLIVSLFDSGGTLLFQQCTSTALAPFCSAEWRPLQGQKGAIEQAVEKFAPGWTIEHCGTDMNPGLYPEHGGKQNVLITHPLDKDTACVLKRKIRVADKKPTTLRLTVGHHPDGDWDLIVKVDKREVLHKTVGQNTTVKGWQDVNVDLSGYSGEYITLELLNQPTGWQWEGAYWAKISIDNW